MKHQKKIFFILLLFVLKVNFIFSQVGIGTLKPQNMLDLSDVRGTSITDVTGKKLAVYNDSEGNDFYGLGVNDGVLQFHAGSKPNDEPRMVLDTAGNVGIGTSSPKAKLHINGLVKLDGPLYSRNDYPSRLQKVYITIEDGVLQLLRDQQLYFEIRRFTLEAGKKSIDYSITIDNIIRSNAFEVLVAMLDNCEQVSSTKILISGTTKNKTLRVKHLYDMVMSDSYEVTGPTVSNDEISLAFKTPSNIVCSTAASQDQNNFDYTFTVNKGTGVFTITNNSAGSRVFSVYVNQIF